MIRLHFSRKGNKKSIQVPCGTIEITGYRGIRDFGHYEKYRAY